MNYSNLPGFGLNNAIAQANRLFTTPQLQQEVDYLKLQAQQQMLENQLNQQPAPAPTPASGPGTGRFFMQPPAFAQGGVIMPGDALNNPSMGPAGTVWDSTSGQWRKPVSSQVMGTTNWDVKNFGKYSGIGTSQGGIGRAQPTAPAPAPVVAPAAQVIPSAAPMRVPGRGAGVMAPTPIARPRPQPSPQMNTFPGSGVLTGIHRGPYRKAAMDSAAVNPPPNLYQGFQPPAFAQGGVVMPGTMPEPVPFIVGDDPETGAMTTDNRVITSGLPYSMSDRYGEGSATRPEIVVTPTKIEPVGTAGPEMRTTTEPTVIMPNPRTVQENLQRVAAPTGIGANYQPNQPGLRWTGSGFSSTPSGPRQTDIRRFMRSPQGVGFVLNQQADQARQEGYMQREDARFARTEQSQATAQQQAKADKAAEDAAAEARMESMLDALSSEKTLLTPTQRKTLAGIKGVREKQTALDTFMRANEMETKEQAEAAEKAKAAQYAWEDVEGTNYRQLRDGTGRIIQTLPKDKPTSQPVNVPPGMEPVSMDSNGRVTYRKATASANAPEIKTIYDENGLAQSVQWTPTGWQKVAITEPGSVPVDTSGNPLPIGLARSTGKAAPAPARAKIKSITPVP